VSLQSILFGTNKYEYQLFLGIFDTRFMKVSAKKPFQLIYSLFAHEYLGYLVESFVIQLDASNRLTYQHQNISSKNAKEFASGLDDDDYKIIGLMDSIQQDAVLKQFQTKKLKPADFFSKTFDKEKGDKNLQLLIADYIDGKKSEIFPLLQDKEIYVMGNDGEPAWKKVTTSTEPATVLFHFYRNEESTHYLPTVKHKGEKVIFQYNNSQVVCNNPAWLLVEEGKLLRFKSQVDGKKLKPFLNKKFINIPKAIESKYYENFVTQIVSNFEVKAQGFDIIEEKGSAQAIIYFHELIEAKGQTALFNSSSKKEAVEEGKLVFQLTFNYGTYNFNSSTNKAASVKLEETDNSFIFHKVIRDLTFEKQVVSDLDQMGLQIRNGRASVSKLKAFSWIKKHQEALEKEGIFIEQKKDPNGKKYFIGKSSINIEVKESNDWFDIHAKVTFGTYEIPFIQLRKYIISKRTEFPLPNGETAVIPEEWLIKYNELLTFSEEQGEQLKLQKHHVALVQELNSDGISKVTIDSKLEKLRDFETIEDYQQPLGFKGELRPYQKAGYNWLRFLNEYKFGGCLADDMGLGKTVQTLSLLQHQKEIGIPNASLLVMPTSLVYNWQKEAERFVPELKVHVYTGTYRDKNVKRFQNYDVIITSYGITRLDVDILTDYYFDYIILDESQTIKNPNSNIFKAVTSLKSASKLILTGTPVENSTMDLWSQVSFINGGLLGGQKFFRDNFLIPIEKKSDEEKVKKLHAIIKPFILRRQKSQVLTELPDKIEQVMYTEMSEPQNKEYEEIKSYYRNKILDQIETDGLGKSKMTLLQGLTKLRQIANHPKLADNSYVDSSGKFDDVIRLLESAVSENHKILIFSQFVQHLALFREYLDKKGIDYAYLDGSTKDRQEQVERFQKNESLPIFLISLKAGGLGLNLTKADYVFILDPWWNPAIEAQAVDRAHRMGQENTVHTYKFITKDTVEEKILKLQNSKKQLAKSLVSTEDSFVKNLTQADITEILS
jgi:SNF2 family DNA or RNA helicase